MNKIEQERQRFEAWFNDARIIGRFTEEGLWQAWQAAINSRPEVQPDAFYIGIYIEFSNLLRQYQKLREAVCVLEDGAEPEVGDLVEIRHQNLCHDRSCQEWHYANYWMLIKEIENDSLIGFDAKHWSAEYDQKKNVIKIIKRNGKPCVYRSQLEANEQLGEK